MSKSKSLDALAVVQPNTADINVGRREIWVALPGRQDHLHYKVTLLASLFSKTIP